MTATRITIFIIILLAILGVGGLIIWVGVNISPGTYGNIARYHSPQSKRLIKDEIDKFFQLHPETRLPQTLKEYTIPYSFGNDSVSRANPMNADSVNFFFFFSDSNWVIWSGFSALADNWDRDGSELVLVAIAKPEGPWKSQRELNEIQKASIRETFERRILHNLDSISTTRIDESW
jgi:hypothetical protein